MRVAAAVVLVLVLAGCGSGDGDDEADPLPNPISLTQLFTFEDEKTLPEIEAMAKEMSGELVALWSFKLACVANVDGKGPVPNYNPDSPPPPPKVRSSFAYYKADELVAKQQLGPPATDLGWSQSIRGRFVEEWRAAQKPGVRFMAAVIHARGPVKDAVAVESYLTEETQVRYLRDHEHALDAHLQSGVDGDPC